MRQKATYRTIFFGGAAAVAMLLMGLLVALPATATTNDDMTTLTGKLSQDEQGGYVLIEEGSGETVNLDGSVDFAASLGSTVEVTGHWSGESDPPRRFLVSELRATQAAS